MRISDWSSDVCSSDLGGNKGGVAGRQRHLQPASARRLRPRRRLNIGARLSAVKGALLPGEADVLPNQGRTKVLQYRRRIYLPGCGSRTILFTAAPNRSEEHTSELQSLMRRSYAVFCLKKKNTK